MRGRKTGGRTKDSPYRHDRAEVRAVLESEGREAALRRWPRFAVDPIARVLGLTHPYHNRREWDPAWTPLLGTKPDSVVAGELGVPTESVRRQRTTLGIATVDSREYRALRRSLIASVNDADLAGPIEALARRLGVSAVELYAERQRRQVTAAKARYRAMKNIDVHELRAAAIVTLRDTFTHATLQQIGEAVGCTRERVRQVLLLADAKAS